MLLDSTRGSLLDYSSTRSIFPELNETSDAPYNVTTLIDENPEALDGSTVFAQFHEAWVSYPRTPLNLPTEYIRLCRQTSKLIPRMAAHGYYRDGLPDTQNIIELFNIEKDTWSLISALYEDRLRSQLESNAVFLRDAISGVKHSEREIVRLLYENDSELRETQIFIDWLERRVREHIEQVAERFECLFNQTTAWEHTAHALTHLSSPELKAKNLPSCLHPDVVCSTHTRLDPKDEVDNDRYLNYLFLCIRGGDLSRAQRLCMQRGEYWRAVSFEGWRPFHYSGFVPFPCDEEEAINPVTDKGDIRVSPTGGRLHRVKMDSDADAKNMEMDVYEITGNTNRILYKSISWWNAENPNLHSHERSIYAALSGNLAVLTQLLPSSWTDLTWAHFRASVEAKVDYTLRELLHTGPRADNLTVTGKTRPVWPLDGGLHLPDSSWYPKDWTPSDTFTKVEALLGWSALGCLRSASTKVTLDAVKRSILSDFLLSSVRDLPSGLVMNEKGMGSEPSLSAILHCIFYATQQTVLLRNYDEYFETIAGVIPRLVRAALGNFQLDSSGYLKPPSLTWTSGSKNPIAAQALRFLAHFVLFIRSLEPETPDDPFSEIVKGYLCILMADHRTDLIADYTATLPNVSARYEWYSSFLADITDNPERERCLSLAVDAGFEIQRLTRSVVRALRDRQLLLPMQPSTDTETNSNAHLSHLNALERARLASLLQEDKPDKLSDMDRMRISSLDWLFYDPRQRGEVLIAANSLLRTFIAMNCLRAAEQIVNRLPDGTLARAKIICEDNGSPEWLVNTIREYECLVLFLESQEAFADWLKRVHSNKPVPPNELSASQLSTSHPARSLTERLRLEEAKKDYEARLQQWHHLLRLDTEVAAQKLLDVLTYPSPGWLVDVNSTTLSKPSHKDSVDLRHTGDIKMEETLNDGDAEWITDPELSGLGDSPQSRRLQMQVLRERGLTSCVSLLIRLYQTAGMHKECVALTSLIASKEQGLFTVFSRAQIRQLFDRIKESFEHLLGTTGDPLGYSSDVTDLFSSRITND